MKQATVRFLVMTGVAGLLAGGCYTKHEVVRAQGAATAPGDVVISAQPPPPRHEVRTVAPSSEHMWVEGNWIYRDGRWVWMPGEWRVRPSPTATYVPGYWKHTNKGYVYTPGFWE
jgi:hypothetical protein